MDETFLLVTILFVVGLGIRRLSELLKEARRINPENRIIVSGILAVSSYNAHHFTRRFLSCRQTKRTC
jgi:hypothetical protein